MWLISEITMNVLVMRLLTVRIILFASLIPIKTILNQLLLSYFLSTKNLSLIRKIRGLGISQVDVDVEKTQNRQNEHLETLLSTTDPKFKKSHNWKVIYYLSGIHGAKPISPGPNSSVRPSGPWISATYFAFWALHMLVVTYLIMDSIDINELKTGTCSRSKDISQSKARKIISEIIFKF